MPRKGYMLLALEQGGGTIAQFSHPEAGGNGQWMLGGMTIVGDMFNDRLKATVNALCSDLSSITFTFHVEGALVRTLIGKALRRRYEFSGDQLIVKSVNPNEHWKVAWEH